MAKIYNDLSNLLKGYENKWVILTPDYRRIISSGKKLDDTLSKVEEDERKKVVILKVVPPSYAPLNF